MQTHRIEVLASQLSSIECGVRFQNRYMTKRQLLEAAAECTGKTYKGRDKYERARADLKAMLKQQRKGANRAH